MNKRLMTSFSLVTLLAGLAFGQTETSYYINLYSQSCVDVDQNLVTSFGVEFNQDTNAYELKLEIPSEYQVSEYISASTSNTDCYQDLKPLKSIPITYFDTNFTWLAEPLNTVNGICYSVTNESGQALSETCTTATAYNTPAPIAQEAVVTSEALAVTANPVYVEPAPQAIIIEAQEPVTYTTVGDQYYVELAQELVTEIDSPAYPFPTVAPTEPLVKPYLLSSSDTTVPNSPVSSIVYEYSNGVIIYSEFDINSGLMVKSIVSYDGYLVETDFDQY